MKLAICKIIIFLTLLSSFVYSQEISSEELLLIQIEALNQLNTQLSQDYNSASIINQVGFENAAIVTQTNTANVTPGNAAIINQVGLNNSSIINQTGNDTYSEVLQLGEENSYSGDINGFNITSTVHQVGVDNNVEQELMGSNLRYGIFQFGVSNEVIQVENGSGNLGPEYNVTQMGNGMKISITNGAINN